MNKNEFIDRVADLANMSKADATRAVDAVFDAITSALKKGDDPRIQATEVQGGQRSQGRP